MTTAQILILVLGLLLAFFGLAIYKSFIKVIGFVVGAAYGLYLFTLFVNAVDWDPILIYLTAGFAVLVLGVLGTFVAQFAAVLMFFLAGGLVGVMLGKILMGMSASDVVSAISSEELERLIRPAAADLLWFLGGGFLFVIALEPLIMLALSALGAGLVWYAVRPWGLMPHRLDWVIPVAVGVLGLMVQEGGRRQSKASSKVAPIK
jgi:hypothetical protein